MRILRWPVLPMLGAIVLASSANSQESEVEFVVDCEFPNTSESMERLFVYLKIAIQGEVRTADPNGLLEGATLAKANLSSSSEPQQIFISSKSRGSDGRLLLLQSRSPRTFPEPGFETVDGFLIRGGSVDPYRAGVCAFIRSDQALELFEQLALAERKVE